MNYEEDNELDNFSRNENEELSGNEIMSFLLQIIGVPVDGAFSQAMEGRIKKIANDRYDNEDSQSIDEASDVKLKQDDIERLVKLIDKDIQQEDPNHEPISAEEAKQITSEIIDGIKQEKENENMDVLEQIRCKLQSHVTGGKGSKLNEFAQNVKHSIEDQAKQRKSPTLVKDDEYKGWERKKT